MSPDVKPIMSKRDLRERDLRLAMKRIQVGRTRVLEKGAKLSISALAREAGINPATLHTRYPDVCQEVRKLTGKESRTRLAARADEVKEAASRNRELASEVTRLRVLLSAMASQNASLLLELSELRSVSRASAGAVVALSSARTGRGERQ